ncbi:hypothetical protein K435DRAFT_824776 [Dendrothele bispora CBS 962.96]|uniref:Glutaredoxin domain-containing protein n=1 Tax=Dendrothele bispora (strain CBS 962.96) TaxID=1314807 RepID=A0A4S8MXQ7_DENBC|nr:hypothetical protein K435DRAFT_824776 [Dendrothele bispora CBS 962.96]
MSSNFHQVISPTHLQHLLSADLNRVSVLNFWVEWAEPCRQMNEVIKAESQSDISGSFDIESVPTIILRGHTLLQRISGADASALTTAVGKFASTPSQVQPQSKTKGLPAKAPKAETPQQLENRMRSIMSQSKVVLFMKGSPDEPKCEFSRKIVGLLKDQKVEFSSFDILRDEPVRQVLDVREIACIGPLWQLLG